MWTDARIIATTNNAGPVAITTYHMWIGDTYMGADDDLGGARQFFQSRAWHLAQGDDPKADMDEWYSRVVLDEVDATTWHVRIADTPDVSATRDAPAVRYGCGDDWVCPDHAWRCDLDADHAGDHLCIHCPELIVRRVRAERHRGILEWLAIPRITDDPDI